MDVGDDERPVLAKVREVYLWAYVDAPNGLMQEHAAMQAFQMFVTQHGMKNVWRHFRSRLHWSVTDFELSDAGSR